MTNNGSRRRSPGGVFFHLLKNDPKITKESIDYIFFEEQQAFKQKKKVIKRAKRKTRESFNFDFNLKLL
jgi:phosphorylated adapter RNA export protein